MMMLLYSLKIYAFPWRRIGQNVVQIAEEKFRRENLSEQKDINLPDGLLTYPLTLLNYALL